MKKRVCILMGVVGLLTMAQVAGAKDDGAKFGQLSVQPIVNGTNLVNLSTSKALLTEPNWLNLSNNQSEVVTTTATTVSNSQSMIANPDALNTSNSKSDSPDGITSTEYRRGGGGGGGDGITGKNIIYAGVGFVGGLALIGSLYTAEGYSASSTPTITVAYERGLSQHWGVGVIFDYSSVTLNSSGTIDNTGFYYPYNQGQVYNYTNSDKLTGIAFGVTGAYHFSASDKVDPYIGIAVGYTSIGFSYTTNDPNAAYDGNTEITISGTGVMFGGFLGIRIYFTDHIGAWADIGYLGYGGSLLNLGLAAKF